MEIDMGLAQSPLSGKLVDSKLDRKLTGKSRSSRCGKCANCLRKDCGECVNCKDKPKWGGPGVKKQACVARKCLNMQTPKEDEENKSGDVNRLATGMEVDKMVSGEETAANNGVEKPPKPPREPGDGGSDDNMSDADEHVREHDASHRDHQSMDRDEYDDVLSDNESLIEYLDSRKTRLEGWTSMRMEMEEDEAKREQHKRTDWKWADTAGLEEEFMELNDKHKREVTSPK